jgi:hypothetical protein
MFQMFNVKKNKGTESLEQRISVSTCVVLSTVILTCVKLFSQCFRDLVNKVRAGRSGVRLLVWAESLYSPKCPDRLRDPTYLLLDDFMKRKTA